MWKEVQTQKQERTPLLLESSCNYLNYLNYLNYHSEIRECQEVLDNIVPYIDHMFYQLYFKNKNGVMEFILQNDTIGYKYIE